MTYSLRVGLDKILVKIVANRLKKVEDKVVSSSGNALQEEINHELGVDHHQQGYNSFSISRKIWDPPQILSSY